jgi:Protein of unknown function (DUF1236)
MIIKAPFGQSRPLMEIPMKKAFLTLSAAGIALAVAAPSFAQTVGVGVTVAPEERTRIKEYIVQEKVAPVTIKERVSVGAKLPADVELRAVPNTWGPSYSKYRYFYSDNRVYLVEPSSREVVTVID